MGLFLYNLSMTFIKKIPELLLKSFFGGVLLLQAAAVMFRHQSPDASYPFGILLLILFCLLPLNKAKEVFGESNVDGKTQYLLFLASVTATLLASLIIVFMGMGVCNLVFGAEGGKEIFTRLSSFMSATGLFSVLIALVHIITSGVTRWLFACENDSCEPLNFDKVAIAFTYLSVAASLVILLNADIYPLYQKLIFVLFAVLYAWQESKTFKMYFH